MPCEIPFLEIKMYTFIYLTFICFQVMTKTIFTKRYKIARVAPSLNDDLGSLMDY